MQSKSKAELDYLREQLRKNDLANVDFDIDFSGIGSNPDLNDAPLNLKEVQAYLKDDILKCDAQHLNDLTSFFFEENGKKCVNSVEIVEILLKLDEAGVFGYPRLFESLKFNVKAFVFDYLQEKKAEILTPESLSLLIVSIAKALIERC